MAECVTSYFKGKTTELYLRNVASSVASNELRPNVNKPYFCTDSELQLAEAYTPLLHTLIALRDNPHLFTLLVKTIDEENLDAEQLKATADDIINVLFTSLTDNDYAVRCLSQLKDSFQVPPSPP